MQYRKFGKLDWQVSALGFGCMRLPTIDGEMGNIDQEKTTEMIRFAIDNGLNYLDTAYVYHDQKSEIALGKALEDGYRDRVRIATKLPIWLVKQQGDFDSMLAEELQRLQTDTIDFYLMHALDRDSWEKTKQLGLLRKAEAALADGRIRHVGFSFHDDLDIFKTIVDEYDGWTFCQIQYNYMDINFQAGMEGLHYAADRNLGVVIMEPLRGGKLAIDLPATQSIWNSAPIKRKPADWALQWLWDQPEVSVVLSGMSTLEQVKENLVSADQSKPHQLSNEELELFGEVREALKNLRPIPCTDCKYCLPCPNEVNIPLNFETYNLVAMYNDIEHPRFEYENWIAPEQKASACIQCDECLSKCPQHIEISSWMPVIDEVLGNAQPYQKEL